MNLIVSADLNWGVGYDNRLLFRLPPDMRFFLEKTLGGAVIMGRKTLESLPGGNPLRDRVNIVMTGNPEKFGTRLRGQRTASETGADGCLLVCQNLPELANCIKGLALDGNRMWVIGGAEIYRLLLPYSREAFVTRVLAEAPQVDCRMVDLDSADGWKREVTGDVLEWEGLRYRFDRYTNQEIKDLPTAATTAKASATLLPMENISS